MAEIAKNPGIVVARRGPAAEQARAAHRGQPRKAADLGVSVEVVAKAIETMLGGRNVTRYKRDAEQYDVIVQTAGQRPHHAGRHRHAFMCAAATTR